MPVDKPPEKGRSRLEALEDRIRAARDARRPKPRASNDMSSVALAWRMVTELVLGVLIGAGIGWGIDGAVGTMPLFLLIFGLLGFAAGVRTMMRSADEVGRRNARREGAAAQDTGGAGAGAPHRRAEGAGTNGAAGAKRRS
jgi:ATP synthase protein I